VQLDDVEGKTPQALFLVLPDNKRAVTEDTLREEIIERLKKCMRMAQTIIEATD
jgi:hypothetical protein